MKTIVFCLPGRFYSGPFLTVFCDTVVRLKNLGYNVIISQEFSTCIYMARNKCLGRRGNRKDQLPFGGMKYDFLFWIDSDIIFTFDQIARLLNSPEDAISGIYRTTDGLLAASRQFDLNGLDLIPVDWVGMGFVKFNYGVVEKVGYPWFRPSVWETETEAIVHGEDVFFFYNLAKKGVVVKIDPQVVVKHEKLTLI